MKKHLLTIVALALLLPGAIGCSPRMPISNPDPRTPQEYAEDRDACIQKHTFAVTNQPSPHCLHCELYVLCMNNKMWSVAPGVPPDVDVPCCPGTDKAGP